MTPQQANQLTRRTFCRTVSAAAIFLGSRYSASAAQPKFTSKVLWEFEAMDADQNRRSLVCASKGNAYRIFLLPGYQTMIAKIPPDGGKVPTAPLNAKPGAC